MKLFSTRTISKPRLSKEDVLDLIRITNQNIRYLKSTITTEAALFHASGSKRNRDAVKKHESRVQELEAKLAEEKYWNEHWSSKIAINN
jgi:HD-GYP domain-containing protein (c-di-GMP phosphodiesterase class II)